MIVCVDHRTNHGSGCSLNEHYFDKLDHIVSNDSLKSACDYCRRKTLTLELVQCHDCSLRHCLYHRHQEQHECKVSDNNQRTSKIEAEFKTVKQKEALALLKANLGTSSSSGSSVDWAAKARPIDPKKAQLARRLRVMSIKQGARGPPNILEADKLFFQIRFRPEPKSRIFDQKLEKALKVFTMKSHRVGRVIDWSADELGVVNKNHLDGEDQLVLQKELDSGECLTLDSLKEFSHYLQDEQLENGDELLLTYLVR